MLIRFSLMFLAVAVLGNPTYGQSQAQEGAVVGGIAGAILGGIAGHQNDETPEGIAIGGAVGAIAGGLLGKSKDNQQAREYQQLQYRQYQYAEQVKSSISCNDVISLTQTGVGDSLIVNQIRSQGVDQKIGVHEIINLHRNGVSEVVINEMQRAPVAGTTQRTVAPAPVVVDRRPVIVDRRPVIVDHHPIVYPQRSIVIERHDHHRPAARSSHYSRSNWYHR